jgi:hypothetical protein
MDKIRGWDYSISICLHLYLPDYLINKRFFFWPWEFLILEYWIFNAHVWIAASGPGDISSCRGFLFYVK